MPGIKRTELQRHDLSIPGYEVIQYRVEIGREAPLVKHFHPGEEIVYLLKGRSSTTSKGSHRSPPARAPP